MKLRRGPPPTPGEESADNAPVSGLIRRMSEPSPSSIDPSCSMANAIGKAPRAMTLRSPVWGSTRSISPPFATHHDTAIGLDRQARSIHARTAADVHRPTRHARRHDRSRATRRVDAKQHESRVYHEEIAVEIDRDPVREGERLSGSHRRRGNYGAIPGRRVHPENGGRLAEVSEIYNVEGSIDPNRDIARV